MTKAEQEAPQGAATIETILLPKITPKELVSREAMAAVVYGRVTGFDRFETPHGETVRFRGDVRMQIPGNPPLELRGGAIHLPPAGEAFLASACAGAAEGAGVKPERVEVSELKRTELRSDCPSVDFAFELFRQFDHETGRKTVAGYVWGVKPLIAPDPANDPLRELADGVRKYTSPRLGTGS